MIWHDHEFWSYFQKRFSDQPCCLRFKIGLNQDNTRMLCEFHSEDEHGMYEYVCNQDPDFPGDSQVSFFALQKHRSS